MLVDLLIRNAHILTQDPDRPIAGSLLIHDGKVLDVDPDAGMAARAARVIDAAGATIVPGFNDVHAHSVWFGLGLMEAGLGTVESLEDVYDVIAEAAAALEPDEWSPPASARSFSTASNLTATGWTPLPADVPCGSSTLPATPARSMEWRWP